MPPRLLTPSPGARQLLSEARATLRTTALSALDPMTEAEQYAAISEIVAEYYWPRFALCGLKPARQKWAAALGDQQRLLAQAAWLEAQLQSGGSGGGSGGSGGGEPSKQRILLEACGEWSNVQQIVAKLEAAAERRAATAPAAAAAARAAAAAVGRLPRLAVAACVDRADVFAAGCQQLLAARAAMLTALQQLDSFLAPLSLGAGSSGGGGSSSGDGASGTTRESEGAPAAGAESAAEWLAALPLTQAEFGLRAAAASEALSTYVESWTCRALDHQCSGFGLRNYACLVLTPAAEVRVGSCLLGGALNEGGARGSFLQCLQLACQFQVLHARIAIAILQGDERREMEELDKHLGAMSAETSAVAAFIKVLDYQLAAWLRRTRPGLPAVASIDEALESQVPGAWGRGLAAVQDCRWTVFSRNAVYRGCNTHPVLTPAPLSPGPER